MSEQLHLIEPPPTSEDTTIARIMVGRAGEHQVLSDLFLRGLMATVAPEGCAFDVAAYADSRVLRIQVKATERPINKVSGMGGKRYTRYRFMATQRSGEAYDVDAIALVALDLRAVRYVSPTEVRHHTMLRSDFSPAACDASFAAVVMGRAA